MPFRRLPDSDPKRWTALKKCKSKADATLAAARPMSVATFDRLTVGFAEFSAAILARSNALAAQTTATRSTKVAYQLSKKLNAHFIQSLNKAISRGLITKSARAFYGLNGNSKSVPIQASEGAVATCAGRLIAGEATRIAAGGAAILFPTIAEVEASCGDFEAQRIAQGKLSTTMADMERAVALLRPAVDELILDLWDEIEFAFRHYDAPALRKKSRRWGVFYDRRPGEPVEMELEAVT